MTEHLVCQQLLAENPTSYREFWPQPAGPATTCCNSAISVAGGALRFSNTAGFFAASRNAQESGAGRQLTAAQAA
jgi:hypothetical protein